MRKISCLTSFLLLFHLAFSQTILRENYWQQQVDHQIDVSLNVHDKSLEGFQTIHYTNHSPDTLSFIWFHVWPNAYKNDRTAFSDQLLTNGNTQFYFADKEKRGYINRLDFRVNDVAATTEDHPQHIDIIKLVLPAPLYPGNTAIITTPFHVKLPYNFSRGGYTNGQFQITQWYPKPAVYDAEGWHPMPYLDQGEYYNEFGTYDVRITIPADYVVAATGQLQDQEEIKWMLEKPALAASMSTTKKNMEKQVSDTVIGLQRFKTLHFRENNITDFAWFAAKDFIVKKQEIPLKTKSIDAYIFYRPGEEVLWENSFETISQTLQTRGEWMGEYPYSTISFVSGEMEYGGGMEYPGITIISGVTDSANLAMLIEHEAGHNWLQAILANNERRHAWLDEGLNTYYGNRYNEWVKYKKGVTATKQLDLERILFQTQAAQTLDQPINISSEFFTGFNYDLHVYYKAASIFSLIENYIGRDAFDKGMKDYFADYKFTHVSPADIKHILEKTSGKNLDSLFALFDEKGKLSAPEKSSLKVISPLSLKQVTNQMLENNLILVSPAIGFNTYDKLMAGGLITNYKLPTTQFQFLLTPMYATGSKQFTGLGKLNYSFFPASRLRKIDLFLNASRFSINDFTNSDGTVTSSMSKIVPGVRLTLKPSHTLSQGHSFIQVKNYLIREESFRFFQDTIITGTDTSYKTFTRTVANNRNLFQLKIATQNFRELFPYSLDLTTDVQKDFIRTAFTATYFYNYGVTGGLDIRLFAGKFFYTSTKTPSKQFSTERYHLNMTGANGYEDYTYSNYFIGRNEFEGLASQQIMIRDGGFKVRTDLLADKVGKTDDWLFAMNFSSSIPDNINPLSVLPVKIPWKVYADVGTHAAAWEENAEADRFLFNAGLQFSLFKNVLNIYVPLVYSRVYKDYIQSTIPDKRLLKTLSFSIDFSQVKTQQLTQWIGL